jgi:hypothetical protein
MRYLGTSFSVPMGADDQDKWTENWERTFGKKAPAPAPAPDPECSKCGGTGEVLAENLIVRAHSVSKTCDCLK